MDFIELRRNNLNIIPCDVKTKRSKLQWKKYQTEFNDNLFDVNAGVAIITGSISGSLEVLDFDNKINNAKDIIKQFHSYPEVKEIISKYKLPIETTQSGGYHIFYRCGKIDGSLKLAQAQSKDGLETIIETRGEGAYVVTAPSHGYKVIHGSLTNIATITVEERDVLLSYAKSFNEISPKNIAFKDVVAQPNNQRIGDIYNAQAGIKEEIHNLLMSHGWQYIYGNSTNFYYRRPGKTKGGISAAWDGKHFYVFSTNADPFESGRACSAFVVKTLLDYNGDFKRCTKDLAGVLAPKVTVTDASGGVGRSYTDFIYDINGKHYIDYEQYMTLLFGSGFRRIDRGNNFSFVKITNNIVSNVPIVLISDFVLDVYKDDKEKINFIIANNPKLFSEKTLMSLPLLDDKFIEDTPKLSYFFFNDAYCLVTEDDVTIREYDTLEGYVWQSNISKHNIKSDSKPDKSVFESFVDNITDFEHTPDRTLALTNAIGFLLHRYKYGGGERAIVLCDEGDPSNLDPDNAMGGTGKSLICKALSYLRNTVNKDGRTFNPKERFAFQDVSDDTNLIWIDDLDSNFPFQTLYSIITNDLPTEAKNQNVKVIPYEKSPKFVLTTNFTVQDSSDSGKRRLLEIELTPYYNLTKTPRSEFGHSFFNDWSGAQWRDFFFYMMDCVCSFLRSGLKDYEKINLDNRKFIQKLPIEIIEFMDYYLLNELEHHENSLYRLYRVKCFDAFNNKYNKAKYSSKVFARKIKEYFDYNNIEVLTDNDKFRNKEGRFILLNIPNYLGTPKDENIGIF